MAIRLVPPLVATAAEREAVKQISAQVCEYKSLGVIYCDAPTPIARRDEILEQARKADPSRAWLILGPGYRVEIYDDVRNVPGQRVEDEEDFTLAAARRD